MKNTLALFAVLAIGFGAIFALSREIERLQIPPDAAASDGDLYFSPDNLRLVGADFRGLIADWYWINSLQYLGSKILNNRETVNINDLRPLNPRLLYPMLDRATTLDPQFFAVYSYGAAILPAIDPQQAVKLLEKGIAANPDDWRLYQNLGYIYWQQKDYALAARFYTEGAAKPGAPDWMRQMSANMQAQGGSREFALEIYKQMFDAAEDEQTRTFAELRYRQAQAFIEIDALNSKLSDFKNRNGRCPASWRAFLPKDARLRADSSQNPLDPAGVPYILNVQNCTVALNPQSPIPAN